MPEADSALVNFNSESNNFLGAGLAKFSYIKLTKGYFDGPSTAERPVGRRSCGGGAVRYASDVYQCRLARSRRRLVDARGMFLGGAYARSVYKLL
ncbi:MAG TPA: hypothetical protein ENN22_01670 [bacterium]|nr:hypothetical protein [bacterium]